MIDNKLNNMHLNFMGLNNHNMQTPGIRQNHFNPILGATHIDKEKGSESNKQYCKLFSSYLNNLEHCNITRKQKTISWEMTNF